VKKREPTDRGLRDGSWLHIELYIACDVDQGPWRILLLFLLFLVGACRIGICFESARGEYMKAAAEVSPGRRTMRFALRNATTRNAIRHEEMD
jgi:hypothetical protein